jgi:hypothetical protein
LYLSIVNLKKSIMTKRIIYTLFFIYSLLFSISCDKDDPHDDLPQPSGKITIKFEHYLDDQPVVYNNKLGYTNEAGNKYEIREIKYFISDVKLYKNDKVVKEIKDWEDIYYVDTNDSLTFTWKVFDVIPLGTYDKISFVFGIRGEKNNSYMYPNSPENAMFWPDHLGGGYHYLMINGFWLDDQDRRNGFNFHLGIGQERDSADNIIGFIQNYYTVELSEDFTISQNQNKEILLRMNVEEWFKNPYTYNHDEWGGDIMEKQDAMMRARENGKVGVWEIVSIK